MGSTAQLTDVSRSDEVSLVSSRLERVLGHVRGVDGLEVSRSGLANGSKDGRSAVGLDLLVSVVLDDETRNVLDAASDGSDVSFVVLERHSDLSGGHSEPPEP